MPSPISNGPGPQCIQLPDDELAAAPASRVVTIDPVVIEGEGGVQQLVEKHTSAAPPSCVPEAKALGKSVASVAAGVAATVAGSATGGPIGIAAGLASLFMVSVEAGERLAAFVECKKP